MASVLSRSVSAAVSKGDLIPAIKAAKRLAAPKRVIVCAVPGGAAVS
jgi:hypothetical protein